ncbi:MAG: polysaccharide deacetylase [Lachnospiraceae bacterium]|nr:polysaccharide deacetylase [Lachnospiraceae bacterium]
MSQDKKDNNLKDTRDKRKRVERIKNGIIIAIFVSIIVSLIAIIGLIISIVNMIGLSSRIEDLEKTQVNNTQPASTAKQENNTDTSNIIQPDSGEVPSVYLTFDDGPSTNTESILNTLAKYNVKATFFLVAKEDDASKDLIKRMSNEGHSIGVHSYSNKYSEIYSSIDSFKNDVDSMRSYLESIIGYKPTLYRFPGGSGNKVTNVDIKECISYLDSLDMKYFDWNVSSGDAASNAYTSDELVENVMKDVVKYKTSVVLLHDADNKGTTAEALPSLIEALQAANVNLLPITDATPLVQHVKAK